MFRRRINRFRPDSPSFGRPTPQMNFGALRSDIESERRAVAACIDDSSIEPVKAVKPEFRLRMSANNDSESAD